MNYPPETFSKKNQQKFIRFKPNKVKITSFEKLIQLKQFWSEEHKSGDDWRD